MRIPLYLILGAALAAPIGAGAANFDGKSPVLCATLEAVQCAKAAGSTHACARGLARGLNVPQFVKLDFAKKQVTATRESGVDKTSAIANVARGNGHLILQGVDSASGRGWSLVLEEDSGHMTASAVGDEEGMLVFGACTQL